MSEQRLCEAGSFVPFDLRIGGGPDRRTRRGVRRGTVLSCDISGFSALTNEFLAKGEGGIDALHRLIDQYFCTLLERIVAQGGKPLFFAGDALLSIWEADIHGAGTAGQNAVGAALALAEMRRRKELLIDLNLHVSEGSFELLEVGGSNDQWHVTAIGSAMTELQRIGGLRARNKVIVAPDVIAACGDALRIDRDLGGAATVAAVSYGPVAPLALPKLDPEALPYLLSRSPNSVRRWLSTLGLQWVAEQRPVTAILTTLHDFDQSDPMAGDRLVTLVRRIQECVQAQDGAIDNVMIDDKGAAILSVFGVPPDAHSDDPARGVVSAVGIRDALSEMGQASASAVATGRAFCALIGNDHLRSYMVGGDVVTRASRISAAMDPRDSVRVDATTMRATTSVIGYDAQRLSFQLKGIKGATPTWAVPPRDTWTVLDRGVSGRTAELEELRGYWDQVRQGPDSVGVVIAGEAGSGKTTLSYAMRDLVFAVGGRFVSAQAARVTADIPLLGLRQIVQEGLGITSTMSEAARRRVVFDRLPERLAPRAPLLGSLLECGLGETEETRQLSGSARAEALEELVCDIIATVYGHSLVCLCFEDAQFLDAASRRILSALIPRAPGLLILTLAQSDGVADADIAPPWHRIDLGPLDAAGLEALLCGELRCATVDPDLLERIRTVSQGQPLFATEVLRGLVETKSIAIQEGHATLTPAARDGALPLPHSVFAAILQRLDGLEPDSLLSLRTASVLGQSFSLGQAVEIHPLKIDTAVAVGHFTEHVHRGFLEAQMIGEDQGYRFRHEIVRDVAYGQLPLALRRVLHGKVAQWLETHSNRPVTWSLSELAHHWAEGGETAKAITYLDQEAGRVFLQGFGGSAVQVGQQAVRLVGLETPADTDAIHGEIGQNIAAIGSRIAGRAPSEFVDKGGRLAPSTEVKVHPLMVLAPYAFQTNQFDIFAWAASSAVRLLLQEDGTNALAFSLYSIVVSVLTGDRTAGAEWSQAALTLDEAEGGQLIHAVGFIDTWFHTQWRAPRTEAIALNQRGAAHAIAIGDGPYASYNISGEVVMVAASGATLDKVITVGRQALRHPLARTAEMHVHLEVQCARALRGETDGPDTMTGAGVDAAAKIDWVLTSDFANQIGYLFATRTRLLRHGGAWGAAIAATEAAGPIQIAIAGQTAQVDLVLHGTLARVALAQSDPDQAAVQAAPLQAAAEQLRGWAQIQPDNFGARSELLAAAILGLTQPSRAAHRLVAVAETLGDLGDLQCRALALEYAARAAPSPAHITEAVAAYRDWGATAVADRLAKTL